MRPPDTLRPWPAWACRPTGVHIGGGEPFGDFDRLLAVVRAARPAGLDGIGYVETNGFWAADESAVRVRLTALAEAGMRQLSISADPYHQEFVPPDRVRLLYETARAVLGPRGVRVRRWKWLKEGTDVSRLTEAERQDLFRTFLRRYPERMTGRAAECLAPLADRVPIEALPHDDCRRAILESGHVHVDPAGWVYPGTCAGIVLGRAGPDHPLDAVLCEWRPSADPVASALVAGGPAHLLDEAVRDRLCRRPRRLRRQVPPVLDDPQPLGSLRRLKCGWHAYAAVA